MPGQSYPSSAPAKIFAATDTNADGFLSASEMCTAVEKLIWKPMSVTRAKHLADKFGSVAEAGSPLISLTEFKEVIKYLEKGATVQDEVRAAWTQVESLEAENRQLRSHGAPPESPVRRSRSFSEAALIASKSPAAEAARTAKLQSEVETLRAEVAAMHGVIARQREEQAATEERSERPEPASLAAR